MKKGVKKIPAKVHLNQVKKPPVPNRNLLIRNLSILLFLFGVLLYSNTFKHDYVLDDFSVIKENNFTTLGIKGIPTLLKTSYRHGYFDMEDGLYRPLSLVMFAMEWELWPDNPVPSHVINVLLYGLTGILAFLFLIRLFPGMNLFLPFMAAGLFIAHPLHTEVVANIKSRDEILCFLFSTGILYILAGNLLNSQIRKIVISCIFFFLALLSKETGILILALAAITLWFKNPEVKIAFKFLLALSFVAGIYLLIRSSVLGPNITDNSVSVIDNLLLSAPDFSHRIATAIKILGLYLSKHFIPYPLIFDYSFHSIAISGWGDYKVILSLLIYLALGAVGVFLSIRRNPAGFGILFFLISISLFSNILFTIGTAMGERFTYFCSFGFCLSLTYAINILSKNDLKINLNSIRELLNPANKASLVMSGLILFFSLITYSRNKHWKDNFTLYGHDVQTQENSARIHYYLGNEIVKTIAPNEQDPAKKTEWFNKGILELNKSLEIYPGYQDAHTQLGVAYYRTNNLDKAAEQYNIALKTNPNDVVTLNNLAGIYFAKANYKFAIETYLKVHELNPLYFDALMNLGSCYGMIGDFDNSIAFFNKSIKIKPNDAQAHYYLSITWKNKGDPEKAAFYATRAGELNPSFKSK